MIKYGYKTVVEKATKQLEKIILDKFIKFESISELHHYCAEQEYRGRPDKELTLRILGAKGTYKVTFYEEQFEIYDSVKGKKVPLYPLDDVLFDGEEVTQKYIDTDFIALDISNRLKKPIFQLVYNKNEPEFEYFCYFSVEKVAENTINNVRETVI